MGINDAAYFQVPLLSLRLVVRDPVPRFFKPCPIDAAEVALDELRSPFEPP